MLSTLSVCGRTDGKSLTADMVRFLADVLGLLARRLCCLPSSKFGVCKMIQKRKSVERLEILNRKSRELAFGLEDMDWSMRVDREKYWAPDNMGPLCYLPAYTLLNEEEKRREANAADIFINTNRIDNTPVSLIEAWAMGLPIVSTDVGGIRDLLDDGQAGIIVADDDAEAMAKAVLQLIEDPDLAERLSRKGRQMAERCGWRQIRGQWDRLFASLGGCDG